MLLLLLCVLLSGCGAKEDPVGQENDLEVYVEATPEPTPAPTPLPSATPVPRVNPSDYVYEKYANSSLNVGFLYPTHWINVPGKQTICYEEPVNPGETGARIAVAVRKVKTKPDGNTLVDQLGKFLDSISFQFEDFEKGSVGKSVKLAKRNAFNASYTGVKDGVAIKGYVITTCISKEKLIYLLHFSAPADRYDEMDPVLKKFVGNVVTFD